MVRSYLINIPLNINGLKAENGEPWKAAERGGVLPALGFTRALVEFKTHPVSGCLQTLTTLPTLRPGVFVTVDALPCRELLLTLQTLAPSAASQSSFLGAPLQPTLASPGSDTQDEGCLWFWCCLPLILRLHNSWA